MAAAPLDKTSPAYPVSGRGAVVGGAGRSPAAPPAVEGRGLRGSVSAGMCVALEAAGLIPAFDRIYGCSAGALNGAFAALLRSLGFDVDLLQARVVISSGGLGIRFDHLCLLVNGSPAASAEAGSSSPMRVRSP